MIEVQWVPQEITTTSSAITDGLEFFRFLSMPAAGQPAPSGLCLYSLAAKVGHEGCSLSEDGLLQTQAALIGFWMDGLQKDADVDRYLSSIPSEVWQPSVLRTVRVRVVRAQRVS